MNELKVKFYKYFIRKLNYQMDNHLNLSKNKWKFLGPNHKKEIQFQIFHNQPNIKPTLKILNNCKNIKKYLIKYNFNSIFFL